MAGTEESVFKLPQPFQQSGPAVNPASSTPDSSDGKEEKTASEKPVVSKDGPPSQPKATKELEYVTPTGWGSEDPPSQETGQHYFLEELKGGVIVAKHLLTEKSVFSVGRLPGVDIKLEHPSLSRHHAIIQYKAVGTEKQPKGFYVYDLGSTHGTYHNKHRCFPKTYYRLRVGHCLKFGGSTRLLILQGPEEDQERESELTVTELKRIAAEKARMKAEEEEKRKEAEESKGISWGMADDAEDSDQEEDKPPDMTRNPFAVIKEEKELNLSDPKKTLKNWYEREGYDEPEYEVSEVGYAHFKCTLELPVDDEVTGRPLIAEVKVKGKKKEAQVQCALEACKLLDRAGMLSRSGSHQSAESMRKKMARKLADDDFYASDEDEFLDRTGTLESKRKKRMKMFDKDTVTEKPKAETHDTLVKRNEELLREISETRDRLEKAMSMKSSGDVDLDSYVEQLKNNADAGTKESITKLKMRIQALQKEQANVENLVKLTKPTSMPEVKKESKLLKNFGVPKKPEVSKKELKSVVSKPLAAFQDDDEEDELVKKKLKPLAEFKKELMADDKPQPEIQQSPKPKKTKKQKPIIGPPKPQPETFLAEKSYGDLSKEDDKYETWVPPEGQTGDGRTKLNEKFGY